MVRGPDPRDGKRPKGRNAIGEVLRARYQVTPNTRREDMSDFISRDGTKACWEWTVRGTPDTPARR